MTNKIVVLTTPIVAHEVVRQLEFREPKWREVMEFGDPYVWTQSSRGKDYVVPTPVPETVKGYAERLIVKADGSRGDPSLLDHLGIQDAFKVRDAIVDFFLSVDPKMTAGSTPSPTTSSSDASGDPTSSGA